MKDKARMNIRNIGIMAHIDAGKTTTSERILYYSGKVHRMGEVDKGTTTMDWMEQEQERGITITAAATNCIWKGYQVNLIDTPGHVDFTAEVERTLRVLDGAIAVFCAVGGVEPQSETVWHQADHYKIPRIAYVNKMDRMGADFKNVISMMNKRLGNQAVAIQLPLFKEDEFVGMIDVINMHAIEYLDEKGDKFCFRELNEDEYLEAIVERDHLIERIAENNDDMLEKLFSEETITVSDIKEALRIEVIKNRLVPVLCGSSFRNKGVQPLLDAVVDFLPSPNERSVVIGSKPGEKDEIQCPVDDQASLAALVFKIMVDPFVGKVAFVRVFSGTLHGGQKVLNSTQNKKCTIGTLVRMHANRREEILEAKAGEIVACAGFKNARTGDTICDLDNPLLLNTIPLPDPVVDCVIEPSSKADENALDVALRQLTEEDPSFHVRIDYEHGQRILSGMGELHLEVMVERLTREFKVHANTGKPCVAYKETVLSESIGIGEFNHVVGEKELYAKISVKVSPRETGSGNLVIPCEDENTTSEMKHIIEEGLGESLQAGVLGGYPVDDVKAEIVDIIIQDGNSNEQAIKVAINTAMRDALKNAQSTLLEPVMIINILTPEEYLGDVIADLNARRGQITEILDAGLIKNIQGLVPLGETFGYASVLRSITQGRASFSLQPKSYTIVPTKKIQLLLNG